MKQLALRYYKYRKSMPMLFNLMANHNEFMIKDIPSNALMDLLCIFHPTIERFQLSREMYTIGVYRTYEARLGVKGAPTFTARLMLNIYEPAIISQVSYYQLFYKPIISIPPNGAPNAN